MNLPDNIAFLVVRDGGTSSNEAFDQIIGRHEGLRDVIARMPDGLWPVAVDDELLSVHCFPFENDRIVIVTNAGRTGHSEFLSAMSEGDISILLDGNGSIRATSSSAKSPGPLDISTESDITGILSPESLSTFWSALTECRNQGRINPFDVEAIHGNGRVSLVASLRLLPGGLFLLGLTPPTLDMSGYCPMDTSIVETLFASMPTPAVIVGPDGIIRRINDAARSLVEENGAGRVVGTHFLDWVAEPERDALAAAHENRIQQGFSPFRAVRRLRSPGGAELSVETTTLLMPEGEETLVFIQPGGAESPPASAGGNLVAVARVLDEGREQSDQMRSVLDLLRVGTGATGVSVMAGGRLHASGEVPLNAGNLADSLPLPEGKPPEWTAAEDGSFTFQSSIRLRNGMARMSLYGLRTSTPTAMSRLVISLAPYLADLAGALSAQKDMMNTASTILDTWDFMRMGDSGPEKFLARAADVTGADAMIVWGAPGPDGALQPVVSCGLSVDPEPLSLSSETAPGWSYTHSEPAFVVDSASDGRFGASIPGFRSEVAVPLLRKQGRATGVLLAASRQPGAFPNTIPNLVRLVSVPLSLWLFPEGHPPLDSQYGPHEEQTDRTDMEDVLLSLSHRLRAPMTAMKGFCDLLSSRRLGDLGNDQTEAVESLSRSIRQVMEQVERLLSFLRLEVQPDRVEGSWGRPVEILESVIKNLEPRIREGGLTMVTDLPQSSFTAFFDRQRLEEVIWNLLDNAVRFTGPDGTITARMRGEQSSWTLEIEDTGRGIPAKSLPYVFDRFYRGVEDQTQGLGIGLSIVRRFTESMGGTINVFSREARGTRFMLRLPVSGKQD